MAETRLYRQKVAVLHGILGTQIQFRAEGLTAAYPRLYRQKVAVLYDPSQHFTDLIITSDGETSSYPRLYRTKLAVLVEALYGNVHYWDGTQWLIGPAYYWDGAAWIPAHSVRVWNGESWVTATT